MKVVRFLFKIKQNSYLKFLLLTTALISTPSVIGSVNVEASTQDIYIIAPTKQVAVTNSLTHDSNGNPYGIGSEHGATPEESAKAWQYLNEQWEKSRNSSGGIYTVDSQGNWSADEGKTTTAPTTTKKTQQETITINGTFYNDFSADQYWAKDMKWMIDNGYITGYVNQKHPTTGKRGSWLNPGGQLTESQMLTVLLRYALGETGFKKMQKEVPNPKNNWSYNLYYGAEKAGIVTKGSTKTTTYANKQVTRGQLAQALVSMHYGKPVTLNEAVKFMFDNKITGGTDATKGATLENFAPNTKLSRAHISVFLKKYHDVKASGSVKDVTLGKDTSQNTGANTAPVESVSSGNGKDSNIYSLVAKKTKTADVVGSKIKTKFGERAYGAKTQADYDATMKIVEKEFKDGKLNLDGVSKFTDQEKQIFNDYFFKGKTAIKDKRDSQYRTQYNQKLLGLENTYGSFKGEVQTVDDVQELSSLVELFQRPTAVHADLSLDLRGIDPISAYDLLVKGQWDCTSGAYYMNAVLDQMGIDSFVLESPARAHAFSVVMLYGDWYVYDNGTFLNGFVKLSPEFLFEGDNFNYAPNAGLEALPTFMQKLYKPHN